MQDVVYMQIGTNDGMDRFRLLVRAAHPSKVILVEPNSRMNHKIGRWYANIGNVIVENVAITDVEKGIVRLVIPRNRRKYSSRNYSLLPMDDWGNDFEEIKAPSMTFNDLCKKHDISHVRYLQIDTEGYDYEIIKSIDFGKVAIDTLVYEDWSFGSECFSRYGEKANQYGVNGMVTVAKLLKKLGYSIRKDGENIVATKMFRK